MAWENALDRLVIRQIHLAEKEEVRGTEIQRVLEDLLELGTGRPSLAFHAGYAEALLGLDLGEALRRRSGDSAWQRWLLFGRLKAHDRKGERAWVAALVEERETLYDLLREPGIAWGLLPLLMRTFFLQGDLERALGALEFLALADGAEGAGLAELLRAALTDLLTVVEKRPEPAEGVSNREILRRCQALPGYEELPLEVRVRFELALGRTFLESCEWEEAARAFAHAAEMGSAGGRLTALAWTLLAWAGLQARNPGELAPQPERPGREEALARLEMACACPERAVPEAFFTRGLLRYEAGNFAGAGPDLEQALILNRRRPSPDQELVARMRFFQAAAILASGRTEEARKAAHLIAQALDRVRPDLNTFYSVHEALKTIDRRTALKFLDAVDIGRGTSGDNLLLVALEYVGLGEAERAMAAAERILEVATDLDLRLEALKVRLTAANMTGRPEAARAAYDDMRELLLRRGRFEDLERLLLDESLVGQALDHLEVKAELLDLYEEMEGRDEARRRLQLAVARSLRARKDLESLSQSLAILRELEIQAPDLAAEELDTVRRLLELGGGEAGGGAGDPDRRVIQELEKGLGRPPFFLVVGGNERQRRHHPKLEELMQEWGFSGEWWMANYVSPQRLVGQIEERLRQGGLDGVLLLHWNRHETTEPALALARTFGCPARTVFYAGFTSLRLALAQMVAQLHGQALAMAATPQTATGRGGGRRKPKAG